MRLTEKILICLSIIGVSMKLLSISGGSILFVFSLTFLCGIYQCFGFALFNNIRLRKIFRSESYKGIKGVHIVFAVFSGFTLSAALMAILFSMQHWPGAVFMLIAGALPLVVISIITLVKKKSDVARNVLWRAVPVLLLDVFFLLKYYYMF
jgi:sugar phosphate permease